MIEVLLVTAPRFATERITFKRIAIKVSYHGIFDPGGAITP